jgi:cold shock CspA family protein
VSSDSRHGVVTEFDSHRGVGAVTARDGAVLTFHCTQIADGSREIAVGTPVEFEVAPGVPGRWEARCLRDARAAAPGSAPPG